MASTQSVTRVCQAWLLLPSTVHLSAAHFSSLQKVTGAAASAASGFGNCQAHGYSKTLSQNNGTTIQSLLIVPNTPSRQQGEQHPSGRGAGGCLLKPPCRVGDEGEQEKDCH